MAKTQAHSANNLTAKVREKTGKGASRQARRDGQVPAVLYGHGAEPQHLVLPAREFAAVLRNSGTNAVLTLDIEGKEQLALPKAIEIHPIRRNIQHVDLIVVRRGEKVTVEVNVVVEGEAAPGTLVTQETSSIEIESEALSIPESSPCPSRAPRPAPSSPPAHSDGRRVCAGVGSRAARGQRRPGADSRGPRDPGCRRGRRGRRGRGAGRGEEGRGRRGRRRRIPIGGSRGRAAAGGGPGHPGPKYATTRHNLGFVVADILAGRIGSGFKVHKRSGAEVVTGRLGDRSVVLAKPRTYMNESGR